MMLLHPHSLPLLQHGVPPRDVLPELIQHERPTGCGVVLPMGHCSLGMDGSSMCPLSYVITEKLCWIYGHVLRLVNGHYCCPCADVMNRLELQCQLEGLWPVDESPWEHVHPKQSASVDMSTMMKVHP